MRLLIAGDAHGNDGLREAETWALREDVDALIVVGDVWDIHKDRKLPTHYIRGNHEQEKLWARPWRGKNVTSHEDYTRFALGDRVFGVLGRMDRESYIKLVARGWWVGDPNNATFYEHEAFAEKLAGTEVLLLHDTPRPYPFNGEEAGSEYLTRVIDTIKPKLVFHGHMHEARLRPGIYGLPPCDPSFRDRGYALLDTETLEVEFKEVCT